jgi:protein TonB
VFHAKGGELAALIVRRRLIARARVRAREGAPFGGERRIDDEVRLLMARVWNDAVVAVASIATHGAVVVLALVLGAPIARPAPPPADTLHFIEREEAPPDPAPDPSPRADEDRPRDETRTPRPTAIAAPSKVAVASPTVAPTPDATTEPEPVDPQPAQPTDAPAPPRRRIAGIRMESTTTAPSSADVATGAINGTGGSGHGDGAAVSTPPRRTSVATPAYPSSLKSAGVEGDVRLRVTIDASGQVASVDVIGPSEHEEFNRAARDSAFASAYEPARENGIAVARAIELTVRFRLRP